MTSLERSALALRLADHSRAAAGLADGVRVSRDGMLEALSDSDVPADIRLDLSDAMLDVATALDRVRLHASRGAARLASGK